MLNSFEAIASAPTIETTASFNKHPKFKTSPFTLGIASGDPAPDGFILWTRLAPEPLNEGPPSQNDQQAKRGPRANEVDKLYSSRSPSVHE
ncbi:MAG: PhoD-like phosphatase N-terminal domain-containing protein [Pyrinomonadaceae bacterium]